MNPNLAEEHLKTIRVLMERSALYRRALAPIMLAVGVLGLIAAGVGLCFHFEAAGPFAMLWLVTAGVAVGLSFVLARRQALKDNEPFWSPPTFRVAQALLPPLLSGLFLSGMMAFVGEGDAVNFPMVVVWMLFYGCALHSAGFFMVRGIKWFGWIFIFGAILVCLSRFHDWRVGIASWNYVMGAFFGGLHCAYGIYLYFTEKKTLDA